MSVKTRIRQLPAFDWNTVPLDLFRGNDLTFPTSITLYIAPGFNATVLSGVNSFHKQLTGNYYIDHEADGFEVKITEFAPKMGDEELKRLEDDEIGILMTYIDGDQKFTALALARSEDLRTLH